VTYDGSMRTYACAHAGPAVDSDGDSVLWLSRDGQTWTLTAQRAVTSRSASGSLARAGDGVVRAPMPGTVVSVLTEAGQQVSAGQPLVIVEAMKMEHTVTAPADGVVAELTAKAGQQVTMDEPLAVIGPVPVDSAEPADSGKK
jgi:acetyl-CoA/propionyl-CoA carboxylase biotin carboxyl carrier protein